jgi:hypothetical protein
MTALGRFEPISSIAIRWSPRSDFAPATIANRKCRITTYEVPQSTRSEKWTKRTGSVHRSAKFDGQVKNCYVVEFTDNEPSPLNVDLGVVVEKKQAFGNVAKQRLSDMVFGKEVRIDDRKKDKYGRTIGRVWVASAECQASDCPKTLDAGMALLTMGLAWHYKNYAKEQPEEEREQYSFAEIEARGKKVGLWSDAEPVPPWEWRHRGKSEY